MPLANAALTGFDAALTALVADATARDRADRLPQPRVKAVRSAFGVVLPGGEAEPRPYVRRDVDDELAEVCGPGSAVDPDERGHLGRIEQGRARVQQARAQEVPAVPGREAGVDGCPGRVQGGRPHAVVGGDAAHVDIGDLVAA